MDWRGAMVSLLAGLVFVLELDDGGFAARAAHFDRVHDAGLAQHLHTLLTAHGGLGRRASGDARGQGRRRLDLGALDAHALALDHRLHRGLGGAVVVHCWPPSSRLSRYRARVWIWLTRDSVTSSTSAISRSIRPSA